MALIDRWGAETLFITHFGPHGEPATHLASLVEHLGGIAALAKTIVQRDVTEEERVGLFTDEARRYLQRHMPDAAAASYDQAAPLWQCWLGLARYWKKRGVGGEKQVGQGVD